MTFKKNKFIEKYAIFVFILVFFLMYSTLSIGKHWKFQTSDDLSIYGQSVWHYSRLETPYSSVLAGIYAKSKGIVNSERKFNQLGDHFTPTLAIFAPIYRIYPSAVSLLLIQSFLVTLGVFPVWWLTKEKFGIFLSLVLSFAYLFFVGIQSGIDFNFHPEVIAATWVGFAIYFLFKRRILLFFVFTLLALGSKEDIAAIFVGVGIYLLLIKKWYKIGVLTLLVSLLWFYSTNILKTYLQTSSLELISTNPKFEMLLTQLRSNPLKIINVMFVPFPKIETIITLFASFAFLPFASAFAWFTAPTTLINRFISDWSRYSTHFQYSATITPLLAISTIFAIENIKTIFKKIKFKKIQVVAALVILLGTIWANRPNWDPPFVTPPIQSIFKRSFWVLNDNQKTAHRLLKQIPPNFSVAANTFYVPHIMNSDQVYDFPWILGEPDIYLLSTQNHYPYDTFDMYYNEIQKLKENQQYELVFNQNGLFVFQNKNKNKINFE